MELLDGNTDCTGTGPLKNGFGDEFETVCARFERADFAATFDRQPVIVLLKAGLKYLLLDVPRESALSI
jgi:hypothetical protein